MTYLSPAKRFKTSPKLTRLAVMPRVWLPLPLQSEKDLLHDRGKGISDETARFWSDKSGPRSSRRFSRKS